eukprot:SAG22_NODE_2185_length_2870_cov_1.692891_3_plen_119_part_00
MAGGGRSFLCLRIYFCLGCGSVVVVVVVGGGACACAGFGGGFGGSSGAGCLDHLAQPVAECLEERFGLVLGQLGLEVVLKPRPLAVAALVHRDGRAGVPCGGVYPAALALLDVVGPGL